MNNRLNTFAFLLLLLAGAYLAGCKSNDTSGLNANLTFKDGSHFSGKVVRREPNSLTLVDAGGSTRTFLYTELADIKYAAPPSAEPSPQTPSATSASGGGGSATAASPALKAVTFPAGTKFAVSTDGYLDSCCEPVGSFSVGTLDADVSVGGKVVLPRGARVTIVYDDMTKVDGRIVMKFELGAATFGGNQYVISSVKGLSEPGAVVTYTGLKAGSAESFKRGIDVHLDDHTQMLFTAANPTELRVSQ